MGEQSIRLTFERAIEADFDYRKKCEIYRRIKNAQPPPRPDRITDLGEYADWLRVHEAHEHRVKVAFADMRIAETAFKLASKAVMKVLPSEMWFFMDHRGQLFALGIAVSTEGGGSYELEIEPVQRLGDPLPDLNRRVIEGDTPEIEGYNTRARSLEAVEYYAAHLRKHVDALH